MGRLCETEDLTDIQVEILKTVRTFVDEKILPVATELEHRDEYPTEIVEGMKELGLFGLTIPEEYGGLGESLLTYALVVEEIARGWMSVSGHRQHALHRGLHADAARHRGAEAALPAEDGHRRGPRRLLDVRARLRLRRVGDQDQGRAVRRREDLDPQRPEDVADQRRHRTLVAVLVKTDLGASQRLQEHDHLPGGEARRLRRGRPGSPSPARSRRWATRASTPPS